MRILRLNLFFLLVQCSLHGYSQLRTKHYPVDSLLNVLSKNNNIKDILLKGEEIYRNAGVDSVDISLIAFKVAYLEKAMLDSNYIQIDPALFKYYKKKNLLCVVDFTKKGDRKRFCVFDLKAQQVILDTLVSHGSANGENTKYDTPMYFGNEYNSNRSSLGLIITRDPIQPGNPAHFCKYALEQKHQCELVLQGLEKGINENLGSRAIIMHTTGSKNYGDSLSKSLLKKLSSNFKGDSCYHLDEIKQICYTRNPKKNNCDSLKVTSCYASKKTIGKSGFIGESLGCPTVPEESHIRIINLIKQGTLIFMYSAVTRPRYNYFLSSPLIRDIISYSKR